MRVNAVTSARDEEDAGRIELVQPSVVAVAFVEDNDRAFGETLTARADHIRDTALGDQGERGQHAVVIEAEMQLHCRLAERVVRPGKYFQRQVDE